MSDDSVTLDILQPPKYPSSEDFDSRDELRERELEEARARASQMEKTMRWWSDCTANWREKWGKVRAERNKAREENRQLKLKLESAAKEISSLRREKQDLNDGRIRLEREIDKLEKELRKDRRAIPSARVEPSLKGQNEDDLNINVYGRTVPKPGSEQQFVRQILEKNDYYDEEELDYAFPEDERRRPSSSKIRGQNYELDDNNNHEIRILKRKLEEMERLLSDERSSKSNLMEEIDCLQSDLTSLKSINEDLKSNKAGTESELARMKNRYHKDVNGLNADSEEVYSSSVNAKKLKEMRAEIERLQTDNSLEWSKREKLETEKAALERENKKLKNQVEDLESLLNHKTARASKIMDTDLKQLQTQVEEKSAELVDLRYAYNKIKKQFQEKTAELEHSNKRVEQHDIEVKKLRMRVEELKLELAKAEDEIDSQSNQARKIQRSLDEQTERAESLQVQVQHLTSRLRTSNISSNNTRKYSRKSPVHISTDDDSDLD
uniref:Coiled-coil domain-containing protein 102A n=2 Tax=Actinia tenebrosa TaxID=6105 RepID=A0A6P8IZ33_ACTTE